ncbi:TonB-dependent receptor [Ideonella sp. DXS22W]|uniref:TonB-dependent receptor n=1 Tax=Pseudaquabacterium inlustre TaxID=2984192 RepID=A0ABU9CAB2_9BURK
MPTPALPRFHRHTPLAAALALAFAAPAFAQSAGQLQTVTVTAERRAENAQSVPSSISVVGGDLLEALNTSGQDLRMLAGRVPSLNIESSFGRAFPRFYLRGYGNTDFRLNASQPVSLVYDDVVQENPILKGFPAFDLDRIEVLRGPQGSLFGRNTPAGVVKFESARPSPKKLEGYGSISFGSYQTINAEGMVNVPTSASSALRVSVLSQTRNDWVHNTVANAQTPDMEGYRDNAVRVQYLLTAGNDFSALANVHARDYSGSARVFRANIIKPGTNDFVDGFDRTKVSFDGKNESEVQNYGANLRLKWNLGGGLSLNSITGYETVRTYSRGDIDGGSTYNFAGGAGSIPFPSETADGMPAHHQFTQELRLESNNSGPLNWQAGVFYFNEDYKIESFSYNSTAAGNPQTGYERVRQKNDAYAIFGAVNYQVSPALKLRGGLRYTHDKKTFTVEDNTYSLTELGTGTKDSKLSWDVSGTYALDKDTSLYARVATGFRGSSVQGAGPFNGQSVAGPETNTSYEAGVKADLFGKRARVNFGVFRYDVKDLQLTAVGGASGNANILLNAKKATGQGFELDAQAFVTDNLLASLGFGYNDTQIKDPTLAVSPCGNLQDLTKTNCTVLDPVDANGKALINGNPLPQAPKTTLNFSLKYTQPVANGEMYVYTDWVYRSKINFFLYESTEFTGKALTEGGVRVGYTWANGKYDAAVFGRNITNQTRIVGGIDFNNLTGFINEPRTWGVQFKALF